MVKKDQELARLQATSDGSGVETRAEGLRPENIIWVFGTAKTGSTWLGSLMEDPRGAMRGANRTWETSSALTTTRGRKANTARAKTNTGNISGFWEGDTEKPG